MRTALSRSALPALLLAVVGMDAPRAALADEADLRLSLDAPITLGAGLAWGVLALQAPALTRTSCPCSLVSLDSLDRAAPTWSWRPGASLADAVLAIAVVGAGTALAAQGLGPPFLNDLGVATEATVLTGLLTQSVKIVAARPYPYMYANPAPSQERSGINYGSFWSGHTAVAMAATTSAAMLLQLRGAPRWLRITLWTAGPLMALSAGALMASSGNHFPTDVAAGALAGGAGVGIGDVLLHAW